MFFNFFLFIYKISIGYCNIKNNLFWSQNFPGIHNCPKINQFNQLSFHERKLTFYNQTNIIFCNYSINFNDLNFLQKLNNISSYLSIYII